ncbi:MAG: hypothetical protein FK732_08640 [Asgard group archaeon]|nr:hypothetical protein [Asgard group archaeon]
MKKITLLPFLLLIGTLAITTIPTQAEICKIDIICYEKFDFTGFIPGESWITGNIKHTVGGQAKFNFVYGPIEGVGYSRTKHMMANLETGYASGTGTNELFGTWVGDDQFYGMEIYWSGLSIMKRYGGRTYGWCNSFGTLGLYTIKFHGEFGPVNEGPYAGTTYVIGVITVHL